MSAAHLEGIDNAVQQAHIWVNEIEERMRWHNKQRAYRLLKAVLHALRDHLPINEAADLGAQLPTLIRGVYYDQWHPASTPLKDRHLDAFLATIDNAFKNDPLAFPSEGVSAVFALLSDRVSEGEIADVRHALPSEIRMLWPQSSTSAAAQRGQGRA